MITESTAVSDRRESELDRRLQAHHKALFTRILVPTVAVMSVALVVLYWRNDQRFYAGLVLTVLLHVFNIYFSIKNREIHTPWGALESRSDAFDTFRWCTNFPVDALVAWCLAVPVASIFAAWIILTFGALTEVYEKTNKLITVTVSLVSLVVLIGILNPVAIKDQVFLVACFVSIAFIFWRLEISLVREMREYFRERIHRERVEAEAERIQRAAAIGNSVRSLTHEINNLAAVASLSSMQVRGNPSENVEGLGRLDKSLELMTKISCLVLDDFGGDSADLRRYKLTQFADDTRLLLGGVAREANIRLEYDFPEGLENVAFIERSGSTYLIIHNLAKNGLEAIRERFDERPGGVLKVAAGVEREQLTISVTDNGIGMSDEQAEMLRNGGGMSTKPDGHGLGMLFVQRECRENGYRLSVDTGLDEGIRFTIHIDLCSAAS